MSKIKGHKESGSALLIVLLALSLLSLLGFYLTINANTGIQISDNFETQIQANYAALAGLNHARALIRGLVLDDLLQGPDGTYSGSPSYMAQARRFDFRNPLSPLAAQTLNIFDSSLSFPEMPDDGMINTGYYEGSQGTVLVPMTGIPLSSVNPYGPGEIVTSRYFVKVTDNNGDPSEISGDPDNNPFVDGDGIVIVRSMGLSKTFSHDTGPVTRFNSVAVFEARYKRISTFDLGPALAVMGNEVTASFDGAYQIFGNLSPGIGVIDVNPGDSSFPDQIIRAAAGNNEGIQGGGQPYPSIQDISGQVSSSPDLSLLLDPRYLQNFVRIKAPQIADTYFSSDQSWSEGDAPYIGAYDDARPWNAPGQDPKITVVDGDLYVTGGVSGGGLLIVTGSFFCSGPFTYKGLVLVVGSGDLDFEDSGEGISGEVLVASLIEQGGDVVFGTPGIAIGGNSRFIANRSLVKAVLGLLPAAQISFREITGFDP
jgi:hypothetical protein